MSGKFIKERREELGYSQSQFAELNDINLRSLQEYEQGRKPVKSIKGDVLYKISKGLGCSIEEILAENSENTEEYFKRRMKRYSAYINSLISANGSREIHTPFDDAFRTMSVDCPELLIPLVNYIFNEKFTHKDIVINKQNEHMTAKSEGTIEKIISDSNFVIFNRSGYEQKYQIECQSRTDKTILIRLIQYATRIAEEGCEITDNTLHMEFPKSALIYLRHTATTPNEFSVKLRTPGGDISWGIPVIKSQTFTIDDIFDKGLYMFIPFYLLTYEKQLSDIENDADRLAEMRRSYERISEMIEEAVSIGEISSYHASLIRELSLLIVKHLAANRPKIKEEISNIMGGQVLEYEAKNFFREGKLSTIIDFVKSGICSIEVGAEKAGMSVVEFEKMMKNR